MLNDLRHRLEGAKPEDAAAITALIESAQQRYWKFNSIGHIGREGGPTRWMEPVAPLVSQQEVRFRFPDATEENLKDMQDVSLYLTANDLGDGNASDYVVWQQPHLEFQLASGAVTEILLRDLCQLVPQVEQLVPSELARTR